MASRTWIVAAVVGAAIVTACVHDIGGLTRLIREVIAATQE